MGKSTISMENHHFPVRKLFFHNQVGYLHSISLKDPLSLFFLRGRLRGFGPPKAMGHISSLDSPVIMIYIQWEFQDPKMEVPIPYIKPFF